MTLRLVIVSIPLLVVGCKKADEAPSASATATTTAKPVEAAVKPADAKPKPIKASTVALADGETLAGGPSAGSSKLRWDVPGGSVTLAAVENREGVMVRGFAEDRTFDVTPRMPRGDIDARLEAIASGKAVVLTLTTLVEREPEVGAIVMYDVSRIEWDAAAGKPVVRETWTCDESVTPKCEFPAWTKG